MITTDKPLSDIMGAGGLLGLCASAEAGRRNTAGLTMRDRAHTTADVLEVWTPDLREDECRR
jgi:hypothetical protein